ncbi:acetyl-CoA synthetase-like protein [Stipitochalara longipes BDJ]|nr:acetyl-CoA synthetase-like protein [Stipitochalara longipes BDJ]
MEYHSPHKIPITVSDIPSFIFSSSSPKLRKSPLYFDAENPTKCYSLEQAEVMVKRVAKGLQDLGMQPGERVLLISGNQLHFPVLLWGVIAAGCIFTGCTPAASIQELEYQLKDSGATLILSGLEAAQKAVEAASRVNLPASRIFSFCSLDLDAEPQPCNLKPWTALWSPLTEVKSWNWKRITNKTEAQKTTAIINYSSGTTGFPKGVEISHYNLIANAEQGHHKRSLVANTDRGRARKERLERSGERWLAAIPMYHAYGQTYFCVNAILSDAKVFIMKEFLLDRYMHFLDIYRITNMNAVPTIMVMLSKDPSATNYNFSSIEQAVCGSAPLGKGIGRAVAERLLRPGVGVKQGWGMTECTCTGTAFAPDDEDEGGSVGWLMANLSAKIVPIDSKDFNDRIEAINRRKIGELWLAGPNVMKGYFNKPKETAETLVFDEKTGKRWLRTGDIGYFDERGCLFIVDRLKELIKVKGLQVAPAEIEAVLLLHPGVQDAAVAAVKREGFEYPRGYVVRKTKEVTAKELETWVQKHLSRHKWLAGGISFIEMVPRTASGKVKRRELEKAKLEARESKI